MQNCFEWFFSKLLIQFADLFLTDCLKIWARMMKIDCSRQVWNERRLWLFGLLSEPKTKWLCMRWNLSFLTFDVIVLSPDLIYHVAYSRYLSVSETAVWCYFWLRQELKESQCAFVHSFHVCLEQSIFIILAQIFKQSVRNKSAVSEHSVSTQWALRKHSEKNQRAIREHSEVRASK